MPTLALVGYGKMGRLIESLAPQQGFEVVSRFSGTENKAARAITPEALRKVDVAIEFSTPAAAPENLRALARAGIATVSGTTGWLKELSSVREAYEAAGTGFVWSPNFSIGVAVFRRLVALAGNLLQAQPRYGAWAWEIHHEQKKDPCSGTLLQLLEDMREAGYDRDISVSTNRAGHHPGTHEVGFDSPADTITLRHSARNREGFAMGALEAAAWIIGKRGVYTFDDVLFGDKR